jgi:hypothetical protein
MKKIQAVARLGVIGSVIALAFLESAAASVLTLTGQITTPGTFTISQLQSLGSVNENVNGVSYTGVSLWSFLGGAANGNSNIVTSGGGNNPILRNYLVATDVDGSKSLLSVGEIDPLFGGTGLPYLVAYERNGALLTTPELVVPQDPTGTRNIENLANISVQGVSRPPVGPGGVTTEFKLAGLKGQETLNLAGLQTFPATTDTNVTFFSGANPNGPHDYTGVSLWTLLSAAGFGDILTSYALATGSDGYEVLISLGELDPAFGAPSDLVAYSVDGSSLGTSGFARIVAPTDLRGGRYVSNLASVEIAAISEPPILSLAGIALLGLLVINRQPARYTRP